MFVRIVVSVVAGIFGIACLLAAHYISLNNNKAQIAKACISNGGQWKMNQLREYECVR